MTANRVKNILITAFLTGLWATSSRADVKVSRLFAHHMVLQRDKPVSVWGWADKGERVAVEFCGQTGTTEADECGKWLVTLSPFGVVKEGQPLVVKGTNNTLIMTNVVVGDVWLCAGQSNMYVDMRSANGKEKFLNEFDRFPLIRNFRVEYFTCSFHPLDEIPNGTWNPVGHKTMEDVSACGYFFARRLFLATGIPIGLIGIARPAASIQELIAATGICEIPELKDEVDKFAVGDLTIPQGREDYLQYLADLKKWTADFHKACAEGRFPPDQPQNIHTNRLGSTFNMTYPITRFPVKGAIWYQGEANIGDHRYALWMKALIFGWRKVWSDEKMPIYFVQLANQGGRQTDPAEFGDWMVIREGLTRTLATPFTGMAVTIDIGDPNDLHPRNKFDVGERLAVIALAKDYGKKGLVYSGPLYKEMKVEGCKIRLFFDHIGSGLMTGFKNDMDPVVPDGKAKLKCVAIAGKDKKWVWADAVIDGDTVVVSSHVIAAPVAVRYACGDNPEGANLYNKEGFPASPFRTDAW